MKITIVQGDITKQNGIDAIVNAARPSLLGGGGVDGAIHRAAGLKLVEACRALPVVPEDEVGESTTDVGCPRPHHLLQEGERCGTCKAVMLESTRYITAEPVRCPVGEARITPAFNLPAKFVIHTVGPKYDPTKPRLMTNLLAAAYGSSLMLAAKNGCRTVAFPALSCGVYSYPLFDAAQVAFTVVRALDWDLDEVRFVLFMDDVFQVFTEVLNDMQAAS